MIWLAVLQLVIEPMPLPEGQVWVWPLQVQATLEAKFPAESKFVYSKFFRAGPVACGYVSAETKGIMPNGTHRFAVFPDGEHYSGRVLLSYREDDAAEVTRICGDSW